MDITFNCDKCGQSLTVDEAGAGATTECPKCGQPLTVPSQEHGRGEISATKQCPYCAETIKAEAKICRFCGYDLVTGQPSRAASHLPTILGLLVVIGVIIGGVFAYRRYQYENNKRSADEYEAQLVAGNKIILPQVKEAVDIAHGMAVQRMFWPKARDRLDEAIAAIGHKHSDEPYPESGVFSECLRVSSALGDFNRACLIYYDGAQDRESLDTALRQLDEVDRKYAELRQKYGKYME